MSSPKTKNNAVTLSSPRFINDGELVAKGIKCGFGWEWGRISEARASGLHSQRGRWERGEGGNLELVKG